jgi:hypothetical protein
MERLETDFAGVHCAKGKAYTEMNESMELSKETGAVQSVPSTNIAEGLL